MEKSSSEDSSIHRSPSLDSKDSDFAKPSTSGRPFGRGFTAGAFYGTAGSRGQSRTEAGIKTDKYNAPKGSKYVVFYLDLSFVFLLEFKKCNMLFKLGSKYSTFEPEGVLANVLGLLLVCFGVVVLYILAQADWKRPSQAEEQALSMDFKTLTEGDSPSPQ